MEHCLDALFSTSNAMAIAGFVLALGAIAASFTKRWLLARRIALAAAVLSCLGIPFATCWGATSIVGGPTVDASSKATILAASIAVTMNACALGIPSMLVAVVTGVTAHRRVRSPAPTT